MENGDIKISENFETSGIEFFKLAQEMSLEGIMAKKEDSLYFPGTRSKRRNAGKKYQRKKGINMKECLKKLEGFLNLLMVLQKLSL